MCSDYILCINPVICLFGLLINLNLNFECVILIGRISDSELTWAYWNLRNLA
jgi:hypothetical protein